MRVATDFFVDARDPDPRGFTVVGCDHAAAGTVTDIWVDRSEPQVRYLEVKLAATGRNVLLPITCARVQVERRRVDVKSITGAQFADVPGTRSPDEVTLLEEDRIVGYYAGGYLYATPNRTEPAWQ
jgi:photosynthetic reaction center H subunit